MTPFFKVVPIELYRERATGRRTDAERNAEWDRMLVLAETAWCWRDPESVRALGVCIARLWMLTLDDWGYQSGRPG